MVNLITLDEQYSTTRRVVKVDPSTIAEAAKQSHKPEDKFETMLLLSEAEGRQGEGGLRTQDYFKIGGVISANSFIIAKGAKTCSDNTQVDRRDLESESPHSKLNVKNPSLDSKPLITVVTVVYNGESFLEETILSVINQKYDNIEYIIIDGGSTDGTLDIIKKYEHAIDYWVSEKDKGIYDAMNKGCILAFGKGLSFLNAGDVFSGNVFSGVSEFPYFIKCKIKKHNGKIYEKEITNLKLGMPISHQSIVYQNKKTIYDLNYTISSDYDFSLRSNVFGNIVFSKEGCVIYDNVGASSEKYWIRDIESFKIINKNFGISYGLIFIAKQTLKNVVKGLMKWQ